MKGITILLDTLDKLHFTVKTKDNDKTEHAEVCTFQSTLNILFHVNFHQHRANVTFNTGICIL